MAGSVTKRNVTINQSFSTFSSSFFVRRTIRDVENEIAASSRYAGAAPEAPIGLKALLDHNSEEGNPFPPCFPEMPL